jgi:hypothetical protein
MTHEQINIAIAQACGYLPIPNYAGSLDAMAEARKALKTDRDRMAYMNHLHELACKPADMGWGRTDASALQHATAFCRALNIWTE